MEETARQWSKYGFSDWKCTKMFFPCWNGFNYSYVSKWGRGGSILPPLMKILATPLYIWALARDRHLFPAPHPCQSPVYNNMVWKNILVVLVVLILLWSIIRINGMVNVQWYWLCIAILVIINKVIFFMTFGLTFVHKPLE